MTLAAVTLVGRPPFFDKWAASIRHRPLDDGRSELVYTLTAHLSRAEQATSR